MSTKVRRSFEFRDENSDKFWSIELDAASYSVRFGRRGTQGQEQVKTFPSGDAARASYEKLIAEKLKKGYSETGASDPALAPEIAVKPAATPKKQIRPVVTVESDSDRNPSGLHLAPEDWLFATWRPREIRTRPEAPPFTLESGLKRFEKFLSKVRFERPWHEARMPDAMTPQEGRFWLGAMIKLAKYKRANTWSMDLPNPVHFLGPAAKIDLENTPPIGDIIELLNNSQNSWIDLSPAVFLPLSMIYPWHDVLVFTQSVVWRAQQHYWGHDSVFRTQILPYLSDAELDGLREAVRVGLDPASYGDFRGMIAPLLGLHAEMLSWVRLAPLNSHFVFGLASAQEVQSFVRAGSYRFQGDEVRAWLAHTELSDLGPLTDALLRTGRSEGRSAVKTFATLVTSPIAAPEFLRLAEEGGFLSEARQWFDDHPREAIEGLAGETSGSGKQAAAARAIVQSLRRKLGEDVPETAASVLPELPDGLAQAFATTRRKRVKEPKWVSAIDLPPISLDDGRLSESDVTLLLGVMATAPPSPPHPLLVALRCYATPESLDAFAEALFTLWRNHGMSGKEKWALLSLGALGSDRCAMRIAPYIRDWPGESKHQAANWGLECLRLIGTDTAIMQINQIAQKTKFQALRKNAQETMEAVAEDRGLTRDELEDRIVPDCGLDERGSRIFDFGPRKFTMRISANLKPVLLDPEGSRRDDLPKPTTKDDTAKSQAAVSDWKLLKKQLSEVVKAQVSRMEQALVTQRRWSAADFDALLVHHPILAALIRPLIWGVFEAKRPIATFRVAEDLTFADPHDELLELDSNAQVGVIHPAHIDDGTKARWGEVLADYELIQPFPQLSRVMHRLTSQEGTEAEIVRHTESRVKPIVFAGIAKRLGYFHGKVGDGGSYFTHAKWFPSAGVTAVLQHSWLSMGYFETDPVSLEKAYFVPEKFGRGGWADEPRDKLPLRNVDEVVISEILNDMAVLASRAEEA